MANCTGSGRTVAEFETQAGESVMRCVGMLGSMVGVCCLAQAALAQNASTAPRASGGSVSGVVYDSLAQRPLPGALVQLVSADSLDPFNRSAMSDSLGRYALRDVPVGRYRIGFFHDMLDSLGLDAPLQAVSMEQEKAIRADLAIPSPSRFRAAICGARSPAGVRADTGTVIVGFVRDARTGTPVAGTSVSARWLEFSFTATGLQRRMPRFVATTGANGFYAICNVPSNGAVEVLATHVSDSTDFLDVYVPSFGFLRRDLWLGASPTLVRADTGTGLTGSRSDSGGLARRPMRTGNGRLTGRVVSADSSRVLSGAIVGIVDGPRTRANDRGEWLLTGVPTGTRMLDVRAVGYYPERRPVDVVAGAAPIRIALATMKSVLDTVRVSASRLAFRRISGFDERRRSSGAGRFLTGEDLEKRGAIFVSDVFRTVAGMRLEQNPDGTGNSILLRSIAGEPCVPDFYIDGMMMRELSADELDAWVRPKNIRGIEIYPGGTEPAQFSRGMGGAGCGSVVIWTK
jgi:Carboxypeptidase regulatory-like domain/TonB-dependent Receptor Plug Domain